MNKQEKEKLLSTYEHEKGLCDLYWFLDNAGIKEYGGENVKEHRREMWYGLCQWSMMFHALGIESEELTETEERANGWAYEQFDAIANKKEKAIISRRTREGRWKE